MTGYIKWLSSTKFQVAVLALGMMLLLVARYELAPGLAAAEISKIALAYMAARVFEPVVEYVVARIRELKGGA